MTPQDKITANRSWKWKVVIAGIVIALALTTYLFFGEQLSLQAMAQQEQTFRDYQSQHPWLVYLIAFSMYVLVTALSLPGATAMTLLLGWLLGFLGALIIVSFASTIGATLAFLFSRYLFRDLIQQKFAERLRTFNAAIEREGAFYLFTLRLIPAVPFFVINAVMGLVPIPPWKFYLVSQLGMLPGTIVYVYAGSRVPNLQTLAEQGVGSILTPQLFIAFVLLGLFPLLVRHIMKWWKPDMLHTNQLSEDD